MKRLLVGIFIAFVETAAFAQVGGPGTVIVGGGGSGGGVVGLTSCAGGTAIADNALLRGDGTDGCQAANITAADTTGDLQWEGTTADAFEGNFTFADPTADWTWAWGADGTLTGPLGGVVIGPASATDNAICVFNGTTGKLLESHSTLTVDASNNISMPDGGIWNGAGQAAGVYLANDNRIGIYVAASNQIFGWKKNGAADWRTSMRADGSLVWVPSGDPYNAENADTALFRSAAGIVGVGGTSTSVGAALHLVPLASPPRTCDATAEGDLYSDTSHALCWCDASAWQKLSGAGTCA